MRTISAITTSLLLASIALAFAACSSQAIPPQPSPQQTTVPTANGSAYTYAVTRTQWQVPARGTSRQINTFTAKVSVVNPSSFDGLSNLVAFKQAETIFNGPLTTKEASESFASWNVSSGTSQLAGVALNQFETVLRANGTTVATASSAYRYLEPPIDLELPFRAGNTWDATAGYALKQHFEAHATPETTFDVLNRWNGDGSYTTHAEQNIPPIAIVQTVATDGSAEQTQTSKGCRVFERFSVPRQDRNGKYAIPYRFEVSGTCPTPVPSPIATTFPDWYPGAKQPPSPLYTATSTDRGSVRLPASCEVSPSIASLGEEIALSDRYVDPFGAIVTTHDNAYYAPGIGLVCEEYLQAQAHYYGSRTPGTLAYVVYVRKRQTLTRYDLKAAMRASGSFRSALPAAGEALESAAELERLQLRTDLLRGLLHPIKN